MRLKCSLVVGFCIFGMRNASGLTIEFPDMCVYIYIVTSVTRGKSIEIQFLLWSENHKENAV